MKFTQATFLATVALATVHQCSSFAVVNNAQKLVSNDVSSISSLNMVATSSDDIATQSNQNPGQDRKRTREVCYISSYSDVVVLVVISAKLYSLFSSTWNL